MSSIINTNIFSLIAQRNLNGSQSSLQTSITRLSSGLRINSAADDAAGLAISDRMTAQINGLNQAQQNANNGISLAQTAGGALSQISNDLQTVRSLAVQSANATNSASDRQALDQQVQQTLSAINQIATQTTYNGLQLLSGSFGTANFLVGANAGQTIGVNLSTGMQTNQIGQIASATGAAIGSAAAFTGLNAGDLSLQVGGANGQTVTIGATSAYAGTANGQGADSAYAVAAAINASGAQDVQATASTTASLGAFGTTTAGNFTLNGTSITVTASESASAVANAMNQVTGQTGVTAAVSSGKLVLTASDGRDITLTDGTTAVSTIGGTSGTAVQGTLSIQASQSFSLIDNSGGTTLLKSLGFGAVTTYSATANSGSLATLNVQTVASSNTAILQVDAALNQVDALQSQLGAIQNRFTSTITNLQTSTQNLTNARSGIQDTDYAAETANLSRAQILQQAGISMLAQANALPQQVLKLLQ